MLKLEVMPKSFSFKLRRKEDLSRSRDMKIKIKNLKKCKMNNNLIKVNLIMTIFL